MDLKTQLVIGCILLGTIGALRNNGRKWGAPKLWTPITNGTETSQAFADPYTFTHFLHGILLHWIFGRFGAGGFVASVFIESLWEIVENTERTIQRYRTETVSIGYKGDSILNSFGDIVAMLVGYIFASRVPWSVSLAVLLAIEIAMAYIYKDNLTLNILMLAHPIQSVKAWQTREEFTSNTADLDDELLQYFKTATQTFIDHLREKHMDESLAARIVNGWKGDIIAGDLGDALAAYDVPTGRLFIHPAAIRREGWITEERMNGIILHELAHAYARGHGSTWKDARDKLYHIAITELGWKIDVDSSEFPEF